MNAQDEYVLGTHDDEIARLNLQHRVWRPQVLQAWRCAGFGKGHTVYDIGCGPGFASLDLATIVGPTGHIIAIDKSQRFLAILQQAAQLNSLSNIRCHRLDLDHEHLPEIAADGAWVRWAFAFLREPRTLVNELALRLKPGATLAIHEYFDYGTWRGAPRSSALDDFVGAVITSCRRAGGNWDIGLDLPRWLEAAGFSIRGLHPIIDVVGPGHDKWKWMAAFIGNGRRLLVDMKLLDQVTAEALAADLATWELSSPPKQLMVTPGVIEIVATRR